MTVEDAREELARYRWIESLTRRQVELRLRMGWYAPWQEAELIADNHRTLLAEQRLTKLKRQ